VSSAGLPAGPSIPGWTPPATYIGNASGFEVGAEVVGCTFDGGYTAGLSFRRVSEVFVDHFTSRRAFGDGINAENCPRDVIFNNLLVEDATDDLATIKGDVSTIAAGTINAVIDGATVRRGDAKGISFINIASGKIANVYVEKTNGQGIAVWNDPGFPSLGPANKVRVSDFNVTDAGQWFGADPALYLSDLSGGTSGTGPNHGLYFRNGQHLKASDGMIFNSAGRGVYAEEAGNAVAFDGIEVDTAGAEACVIGNVATTDRTKFRDVRVSGFRSKDTIGGMSIGSATLVNVSDLQIKEYGAGGRRALQLGNVEKTILSPPYVFENTDGGDATVLQTGTNLNVMIVPGLEFDGSGVRTYGYQAQDVSYAASITPNLDLGKMIVVGAMTGPLSVQVPTNIRGGRVLFEFKQDGTGGRVITFAGGYKTNWTPSTAANAVNMIEFVYDHSTGFWRQIAVTTGLT
jgi:hypothetical protein